MATSFNTSRANLSDDVVGHLEDLARVNIDSANGFTEAADQLQDPSIQAFFREQAGERHRNATELQDIVAVNGEEAPEEGSLLAAFHRTWMQVRAAFTSRDDHAILSEAERGEDYIKQMYEDAIDKAVGTSAYDLLTRQYAGVKRGHDMVRDLRDSCQGNCNKPR